MATDDRRGRQDDRTRNASRRQPVDSADERAGRERADDQRQDSGMELSLADREMLLRNEAMQNLLPTPPKKEGWHYMYATLSAPQQIAWLMRLGYRPVKMTEMPGWAEVQAKTGSGDYAGCITVNEMILMKIAELDYQRYMRIQHHDKPNEEQGIVAGKVETTKAAFEEEAEGRSQIEERGSGLSRMTTVKPAPKSFQ